MQVKSVVILRRSWFWQDYEIYVANRIAVSEQLYIKKILKTIYFLLFFIYFFPCLFFKQLNTVLNRGG